MDENNAVVKNNYIEMMPIQKAVQNYRDFNEFVTSILKKDLDYGVIPGTPKPSLFKPGAEKLRFVYGLGIEIEPIKTLVDYKELIVDYSYRCTVRSQTGQILAQCEGNCNSSEPKFGFVWKDINNLPSGMDISNLESRVSGKKLSEFSFAIDKAEIGGQYGKPKEYWDGWNTAIQSGKAKLVKRKSKAGKEMDAFEMDDTVTQYKITNPDIIGMQNTIMKMAQKRSMVGAILIATGASEYFTQDIEDMDLKGNGYIYSEHNNVPDSYGGGAIVDIAHEDIAGTETKIPVDDRDEIPGHWYAKLEKCKTQKAVDDLAVKHKETIAANPGLRKVFMDFKTALKSNGN